MADVLAVLEECKHIKCYFGMLQIPQLEEQLLVSLLPRDEADERDVVLEVRQATFVSWACCVLVQILSSFSLLRHRT